MSSPDRSGPSLMTPPSDFLQQPSTSGRNLMSDTALLEAPSTTALRMKDVLLTFPDGEGRVTAVDHVSLSIDRGRSLAVTGPSGSGKSSLLAVAATLTTPDSGQVWLQTRDGMVDLAAVSPAEGAELRRKDIGIVFQQSNLIESLTAREQLEAMAWLGSRPSRARRRDVRGRADELLGVVGLGDAGERAVGALSGGAAAAGGGGARPHESAGDGARRRAHQRARFRIRWGRDGSPPGYRPGSRGGTDAGHS